LKLVVLVAFPDATIVAGEVRTITMRRRITNDDDGNKENDGNDENEDVFADDGNDGNINHKKIHRDNK